MWATSAGILAGMWLALNTHTQTFKPTQSVLQCARASSTICVRREANNATLMLLCA